ncbi:MAG: hypothetical protein HY775_03725 [Acidobacteria bacterium]|nr:hypothetical protein [Acidobacteriota bacterium]
MARRIPLALALLLALSLWALPASAQSPPEGTLAIAGADYVGGNGDGAPDPGETLRVTVTLANQGGDLARDIRATMRSGTEGVRVVSATASWPDIAPGDSAQSGDPFVIEIAPSVPRTGECTGMQPIMVAPEGSPGGADPAGGGGSEPGSDGTAEPGSTGGSSGEGTVVEPAPTETAPPDPAGTPKEAPPPGETTTVAPEPGAPDQGGGSGDMPAEFELPLDITVGGAPAGTQYLSTMVMCAYAMQGAPDQAGGGPEPRPMGPGSTPAPNARGPLAAQETSAKSGGGSPALPIAAAFLVVVGALLVRYRFSK